MLCISRKEGQAVRIGGAMVRVKVHGNRVQLVIDAPKEVKVLREELVARADAEAYHNTHTAGDFDEPGF